MVRRRRFVLTVSTQLSRSWIQQDGLYLGMTPKEKVQNYVVAKGFNECIGVTRMTMSTIGIWPLNENKDLTTYCKFLTPVILMSFFIVLPQTRKAIQSRKDLNELLEVLTIGLIIQSIALLKLLSLWFNKQDLKDILLQIWNDWNSADGKEQIKMWSNARLSKFAATFCISTTVGSTIIYAVDYLILNYKDARSLFLKAQFPFEIKYSPVLEFISFCQFIGVLYSCFAFSSFDGFFVFSILHFSSQLYNLNQRFRNLEEELSTKKVTFVNLLADIIRTHQQLMKYTNMIEKNFNKMFLIQMFATTISLCLQGYQLVTSGEKDWGNLIFILVFTIANLISLFMYCYISQIIRNESQRLFLTVYETQWYLLSPKDSRLLIILMRRFVLPVEITVGKFSAFSLEYFASVLKTSLGYLSVLLAIRQK